MSARTRIGLAAFSTVFSAAIVGLAAYDRFGAATIVLSAGAVAAIAIDLDRAIVTAQRSRVGAIPRRALALTLVVVMANAATVSYLRGIAISRQRNSGVMYLGPPLPDRERWIPPWEWTAREWRETLWPWK
jgi:hypothetical protein